MYELIHARGNTYYIDCPAKMGLYVKDDAHAYLIDSGNDKEAGKKILKILQAHGWNLDAVIVTHSHADHFGGCAVLQERTGCKVYGSEIERAFMQHPILEPAYLYGGYPPKELRNKFLMAKPCTVLDICEETFPHEFTIIPLPGHYFDMIGVVTPDKVFFCADSLSGEHILEKYHVAVLYDVEAYLTTLETVETTDAELFVPAHAEPVTDIRELARMNAMKVEEIADQILELCGAGASFEDILAGLFVRYNLSMDCNQYVLVGSTVRSYLSYLHGKGLIDIMFADNRMLWARK